MHIVQDLCMRYGVRWFSEQPVRDLFGQVFANCSEEYIKLISLFLGAILEELVVCFFPLRSEITSKSDFVCFLFVWLFVFRSIPLPHA